MIITIIVTYNIILTSNSKFKSNNSPWLGSSNYNRFTILSRVINNISCYNLNKNILKEVIVKIRLEKISIYKGVIVKVLLNNGIIGLVISLKFTKK